MAGNSGSNSIMVSKLCTDGVYNIGARFKVLLASEIGTVGCAVAALVASVNTTPRHNMNDGIEGAFLRDLHVVLFLDEAAIASSSLAILLRPANGSSILLGLE